MTGSGKVRSSKRAFEVEPLGKQAAVTCAAQPRSITVAEEIRITDPYTRPLLLPAATKLPCHKHTHPLVMLCSQTVDVKSSFMSLGILLLHAEDNGSPESRRRQQVRMGLKLQWCAPSMLERALLGSGIGRFAGTGAARVMFRFLVLFFFFKNF